MCMDLAHLRLNSGYITSGLAPTVIDIRWPLHGATGGLSTASSMSGVLLMSHTLRFLMSSSFYYVKQRIVGGNSLVHTLPPYFVDVEAC